MADWQRWSADPETYTLSIETRATRMLLGFMLLQHQAEAVVVEFIVIRPGYRDRGYGTDALTEAVHFAFDKLDAIHITLQVSPDNTAALTALKMLDFNTSATLMQTCLFTRWELSVTNGKTVIQ